MNQNYKFELTSKQHEAVPVLSQAMFAMLYGGSRSGKTFLIIRAIVIRALKVKSRHLIVRFRFNHAKASIWLDTFPKVIDLCFPDLKGRIYENKQDWYWELPNGSQIWLGGIDDKDRVEKILGNEYSTIYCNECSQISYPAVNVLLTRLAEQNILKKRFWFDANPPNKKHWTYQLFIANEDPEEKGRKLDSDKYPYLLMNPSDNIKNLADGYMDTLDLLPKRQRERFKYGLFLSDVIGALWTDEMISQAVHKVEYGESKRTVVSVDPAVTNNPDSDETGIIVASVDSNNIGIVDADYTLKGSPNEWANVAVNAYHKHEANYIVAETNQGGDLVENIIKSVDNNIKVKQVKASKGKFARAEPVSALYEQAKIAHNREGLELLEEEMTSWVPMQTKESPNRIDALVWAFFSLELTKSKSRYHCG